MDQKKKRHGPPDPRHTGSTGPKLGGKNQKYRLEICKMLSLGFSPTLVSQEMKDQFGIVISRHNIRKCYLKNPRRWHTINALRERAAKEVMDHPLADRRVRLSYILRALNHALVWGVDKLYFDKDGNFNGKVEKVQLGVVAELIKQAREEIEGTRRDTGEDSEKKGDLLQTIRILSSEKGHATIIENRVGVGQADAARVDQSSARGYEIL